MCNSFTPIVCLADLLIVCLEDLLIKCKKETQNYEKQIKRCEKGADFFSISTDVKRNCDSAQDQDVKT